MTHYDQGPPFLSREQLIKRSNKNAAVRWLKSQNLKYDRITGITKEWITSDPIRNWIRVDYIYNKAKYTTVIGE